MLNQGEGKQTTATSTTALWTLNKSGANSLSVDVEGSPDVFFLVNCTAAEFDTEYAAGRAIKARNGIPYAFYAGELKNISSVCYRTASTSSAVNFGAF